MDFNEPHRLAELNAAEARAVALFAAIEGAGLIRPGVSESVLSQEIYELAAREPIGTSGWCAGGRTPWPPSMTRPKT